jgi:cytochrome c biogenesis protein CcdA
VSLPAVIPRSAISLATVVVALGFALVGALLTGPDMGRLNRAIEGLAALSGTGLAEVAGIVPFGYAFGAGMVAAVNPCGFALLPAYLALYLGASTGGQPSARGWEQQMARAMAVSGTMTAGFLVVFGVGGLVLVWGASTLGRFLPWVGFSVGVLLVVAGSRILVGDALYTRLGERVADRLGGASQRRDVRGYFAYGLAYAAASLSCALPVFLAVVASALAAGGLLAGAVHFTLYALGMGAVITVLTVSTALFGTTLAATVRRAGRYVQPASGLLLLAAGTYLVYYWLTLGGLLPRL